MSVAALSAPPITAVLVGNPNTGKSTLFNALSGFRALTGNYPGVTVEKKIGRTKCGERTVDIVDLPGTYSLSPRTLDEMVAVNVLLGRQVEVGTPHVVVCIVDASNIERNLYLVSQVMDLGLPMVIVLNMADVAASRGIEIDERALAERLGLPVVKTEAHRRRGIDEVRNGIVSAAAATPAKGRGRTCSRPFFPPNAPCSTSRLRQLGHSETPYYLLERLLLDVGGYLESHLLTKTQTGALTEYLAEARRRLAEQGCRVPAVEARRDTNGFGKIVEGIVRKPASRRITLSDKLDSLLTHRVFGLAFFVILMFVIFQAIFTGAQPLMDLCKAGQSWIGEFVAGLVAPGPLQSLLVDGVIAGVGSVLVFLPQIAILFLLHRRPRRLRLPGAGRIHRRPPDDAGGPVRKIVRPPHVLVRLRRPWNHGHARHRESPRPPGHDPGGPAHELLGPPAGLFSLDDGLYPGHGVCGGWVQLQSVVLLAMTFVGASAGRRPRRVAVQENALQRRNSAVRHGTTQLQMAFIPVLVANRVYEKPPKAFVVRGPRTLILATNVLVWAAGYFPGDHRHVDELQAVKIEKMQEDAGGNFAAARRGSNHSSTNRIFCAASCRRTAFSADWGRRLEPSGQQPLSARDWRIGVGVIASFPAREVIVGTLGTIYSLGGSVEAENEGLQAAIQSATWPDGRKVYNIPVAFSIMIFFAPVRQQCVSTLMVIQRETNSWKWAAFTFFYMTTLAYAGAFVAYRVGLMLS